MEKRLDLLAPLVKALLISSSSPLVDSNDRPYPWMLQGFGKVDKTRALNSQDWRVCYLLQGEFDSANPSVFHRYSFLFPEEADSLDISMVCGKLKTCHSAEMNEYIQLFFKRPGVRSKASLKRGVRIGSRKCYCTCRERWYIQRGSVGAWKVDVAPHFSNRNIQQKIKYGIVIAVSSSKGKDVYSAVMKWIEPQKERIFVPAIVRNSR
jgi:hypothetical protein